MLKVPNIVWQFCVGKWNIVQLLFFEIRNIDLAVWQQTSRLAIQRFNAQWSNANVLGPLVQPFLAEIAEFSVFDFVELQRQLLPIGCG